MPSGAADPLSALIARVTEDLKQRTAAGLASGAILEGEGWKLAAMQLSVARGRTVETLPFVEIDKVAVYDGKLCLWKRGQDEAAVKISPDSKNAPVLASLLSEWVEHQRAASGGQPEALRRIGHGPAAVRAAQERRLLDGHRRCRHRRRSRGGDALRSRHDALGPVLLAVPPSLLLGALFGRCWFGFYEWGICNAAPRRMPRRYDEITEFTYSATRMFYKGTYMGHA